MPGGIRQEPIPPGRSTNGRPEIHGIIVERHMTTTGQPLMRPGVRPHRRDLPPDVMNRPTHPAKRRGRTFLIAPLSSIAMANLTRKVRWPQQASSICCAASAAQSERRRSQPTATGRTSTASASFSSAVRIPGRAIPTRAASSKRNKSVGDPGKTRTSDLRFRKPFSPQQLQ